MMALTITSVTCLDAAYKELADTEGRSNPKSQVHLKRILLLLCLKDSNKQQSMVVLLKLFQILMAEGKNERKWASILEYISWKE